MEGVLVFTLALCSLIRAEVVLEGQFTLPSTEKEEDELLVADPSANSGDQLARSNTEMHDFQLATINITAAAVFSHEGDMTFISVPGEEESNKRRKRNAVSRSYYLWTGGVIPYAISAAFDGKYPTIFPTMKLRT